MNPRSFKWLLDNMTPAGITKTDRMLKKGVLQGNNAVLLSCLNVGKHWITVCMGFGDSFFVGIFDILGYRGRKGLLPEVEELERLSLHLQNLCSGSKSSKIENFSQNW